MTRKLLPRSARLILSASILAVVTSMFIAPAANSEESTYESLVDGELDFIASELAPGADVTVLGDVFGPEATVEFALTNADTGAVLIREQLTTDADGNIEYQFKLPAEMVTAEYRAEISGLTEDGAFVSLEKRFAVVGNVTELQTTTVATTTPTVDPTDGPTASPVEIEPAPTTAAATESGTDGGPLGATGEVAAGDSANRQDTDTQSPDSQDSEPASSEQASAQAGTESTESSSPAIWIVAALIVAGLGGLIVVMRRKSSPA